MLKVSNKRTVTLFYKKFKVSTGLVLFPLLKLASFEADQRPYRSSAANHVDAAVLAHVARSGRLDATHR